MQEFMTRGWFIGTIFHECHKIVIMSSTDLTSSQSCILPWSELCFEKIYISLRLLLIVLARATVGLCFNTGIY